MDKSTELDDIINSALGESGFDESSEVSGVIDAVSEEEPVALPEGKQEAEKADKEAPADANKEVSNAKQDEVKGTPASADLQAPASWRAEEKAAWDAIPPAARAAIARRERESVAALTEANQKLANREKENGEIERVLAPYSQQWAARGIRTAEATAQVLARASYAYQNPQKFIQEFAQENGIDLTTMLDDAPAYVDPAISEVTTKLAKLEQMMTQQETMKAEAAKAENARVVNDFASQVNEQGQPLRPHFDKVQGLMVPLIQQIKAQNPSELPQNVLAKAYDMACRAHPEVWEQVRNDMLAQTQQTQASKQIAAAQEAQKRSISPSGSALADSVAPDNVRGKSLDEVVNLVMNQMGERI